jgi:hypothetical protein
MEAAFKMEEKRVKALWSCRDLLHPHLNKVKAVQLKVTEELGGEDFKARVAEAAWCLAKLVDAVGACLVLLAPFYELKIEANRYDTMAAFQETQHKRIEFCGTLVVGEMDPVAQKVRNATLHSRVSSTHHYLHVMVVRLDGALAEAEARTE